MEEPCSQGSIPCVQAQPGKAQHVFGTSQFVFWVPQVKLIDYIHRQRQCKLSVPLSDRTAELNSYPRFNDWLDIVNVRKEVVQVRRGHSPTQSSCPFNILPAVC